MLLLGLHWTHKISYTPRTTKLLGGYTGFTPSVRPSVRLSVRPSHYDDVVMGAIASHITSLTIVYTTVYWDSDQSKHQSSASLAFVWGIHRGPVNSPHSNAENVSISWRHHVSVRPSRMPCPLCIIYSYGWILFILDTNDHYHERVCRAPWPLTLTYIFKVVRPWLRKSCPLCSVYSSGWILSIFGTNDHYH